MTALKPNLYHESHEGWVRHNGGKCPVHPDTVVKVWFKAIGESRHTYTASQLNWGDYLDPADAQRFPGAVLGYKVIEEAKTEGDESAWAPVSGGY